MKRYPGYLFDLDGTLVDTAPDLNAALNHSLASHGYPTVDEALTRHWVGHGARALVEQAMAQHQIAADLAERLVAVFIEHYEQHIAVHSLPYPGVVDALDHLQRGGARLAVVTNKMTRLTIPLIRALDLHGFFETIVCGDTTDTPKPAAEPALHACRILDVAAADALFVGDSTTDVDCARAAGCPIVVVRDGYNHGVPAEELGADGIIESFTDLV